MTMILGLAVRFVGVLAVAYTLQLWLGLYDNASEWPWTYMFLALGDFWFQRVPRNLLDACAL
jgi:hypothetical protein